LILNDHLNNGASRLLVPIAKSGFELLYNDVKDFVNKLQKTTIETLNNIQDQYNYFQQAGTTIEDHLLIHWTNPVKIEFSSEKELPLEIKNEIKQKFRVVE